MFCDCYAFFGIVRTPLVRHGGDAKLPDGGHRMVPVHCEMLIQVARDFSGLPDIRTLKASEIRFFYGGLRAELKDGTKPK